MFIYNITFKADWSIHNEWLLWLRNELVEEILKTKCFTSFRLLRLNDVDESDGPTYALQLEAESKSLCNLFCTKHEPGFMQIYKQKWSGKMLFFSTLMQIVD